jgi:hypothetical protein
MDGVRLTVPVAPKINPGGQFQGYLGGQNKSKFILQAKVLVRKPANRSPAHPSTLASVNNLAKMFMASGRHEEATVPVTSHAVL